MYFVEKIVIYIDFYIKMIDVGVVYWYLNGMVKEGGKFREIVWFWIWCSYYIYCLKICIKKMIDF